MRTDVLSCADIKKAYNDSLDVNCNNILHKELPAALSLCKRAAEKLECEALIQIDCGSETLRHAVFDRLALELENLGFMHTNDMNDNERDHPSVLIVRISGWK